MSQDNILSHQSQEAIQENQDYTGVQYHTNNNDQIAGRTVAAAIGAMETTAAATNFDDVYDGSLEEVYQHIYDGSDNNSSKRAATSPLVDASESKRIRMTSSPTTTLPTDSSTAVVASKKHIHNEMWETMYEKLVTYKARTGHCLVPKRYAEDPKLGTWVETQRVQYKRLERTEDEGGREIVHPNKRLTAERLQKLEALDFTWVAKYVVRQPVAGASKKANQHQLKRQKLNDAQWEEMYRRLVAYKEKFGDCLVPRKYEGDVKLASWYVMLVFEI